VIVDQAPALVAPRIISQRTAGFADDRLLSVNFLLRSLRHGE
jgi:hypothetical protein